MKEDQLIQNTIDFVKKELQNAEGGHDWFHIERVFNTSKLILKHEEGNTPVVKLAVLLHDIADPKFHGGDESIGPQTAKNFLDERVVSGTIILSPNAIKKINSIVNSYWAALIEAVVRTDRRDDFSDSKLMIKNSDLSSEALFSKLAKISFKSFSLFTADGALFTRTLSNSA